MKTLYDLLRERCGLSLREAAEFHKVSVNTVTKWSKEGDRSAPPGVIAELRELYAAIETAAEETLEQIEEIEAQEGAAPDEITLGIASDDFEARQLGLPCIGAHAAAIGMIAALVDMPVTLVPRGTTPASAAVADLHDRALRRPRS